MEIKQTQDFIHLNLDQFGVTDMNVTGVLHYSNNIHRRGVTTFRDGDEACRIKTSLAELSAMGYWNLGEKCGLDADTTRKLSSHIVVEDDGKKIGQITCDKHFRYEAVPNLREVLAWAIATDGGRVQEIEDFDFEEKLIMIRGVIVRFGIGQDNFFGPYNEILRKEVFLPRKTTRFEGHTGPSDLIWQAVTRELFGKEHVGYDCMY